ncbi:MAG: helix-turn-helix domain-containing protein [Planctomycetota bacterium]|nr:helix-turn-helix domain-containing protein [Planctomycetota bacterium]
MTIGDRIKVAREKAGLNQTQLAEQLGVMQSALSHWERNVKKPSREHVEKLCAILNLTADWFLTGPEKPGMKIRPMEKTFAPVDRRTDLNVYNRERASARIAIPTWLNAAAGPGMFLELSDDYWYIPKLSRGRGIHLAVIRGESMKETLRPGDMIVMQSFADRGLVMPPLRYGAPKSSMREWRSKIEDGAIYALSINNEGVTVKRVLFQGQEPDWYVMIEADNRNEWEPRTIRLGDEVTFFAKVLGLAED